MLAGVLGCGDGAGEADSGTSEGGEGPDASDLPDAEVRYETKYMNVAPLFDEPICAGTLMMLDSHVEYVSSVLSLEASGDIPVYVRAWGDPATSDWCAGNAGCYRGGGVVGVLSAIPHELVHAKTIGIYGPSY